ncbi:MAG: hypothetical protein KGL16_08675 [Acidobacteriota bacterium]|nr:hypothetical protein [Acidobacteriota bacterium]
MNIHTVGLILLIVGGVGFVISLMWMAFYAERSTRSSYPGSSPGSGPDGNPPARL